MLTLTPSFFANNYIGNILISCYNTSTIWLIFMEDFMFDLNTYYADRNAEIDADYQTTLQTVREIHRQTQHPNPSPKDSLFHTLTSFVLNAAQYEARLRPAYFQTRSFDELLHENHHVRDEIHPDNYETSFANPAYAVQQFGEKFGAIWSYFFSTLCARYRRAAAQHQRFRMVACHRVLIHTFQYVDANSEIDPPELIAHVTRLERESQVSHIVDSIIQRHDPQYRYLLDIVEQADLDDPRYLFRYHNYISDYEIRIAHFLARYSPDKIRQLSEQIVKAYLAGFEQNQKDIQKKSTVSIFYPIGYERIIRPLLQRFRDVGLEPVLSETTSKVLNKQYQYDHKFDLALFLDEAFVQSRIADHQAAVEQCKSLLTQLSGHVVFTNFGEVSFSPVQKKEALQLSSEQLGLYQQFQQQSAKIQLKYVPRTETSFTIISFPSPEIGEHFNAIFDEMFEINMLNTDHYEKIQQQIIDVLDQADRVHVKGKAPNETDIYIKLHPLKDRSRQTNFLNCGADVNIPVGEVFTSPQLNGTNGVLHYEEVHLRGLRFENLRLTLKDGFVDTYSCSNFDDPAEGRNYIEKNLLFPHKTLPLGEFAIGTNTQAYVMAKKYNIIHLLPILIIEKMGPHFALGDTCFMMQEDQPVINRLDHKEVIARENEKSALRTTDPNQAYTFCHTDMTLPFESIGVIAAVTPQGERIDILRDGRFVLPGTEVLNAPLEAL